METAISRTGNFENFIDVPASGATNMAVDEELLVAAVENHQTSLRWYEWSEPTVSLGYFQNPNFTSEHPQLRELPVVKRLTGGGAILHHHEWTYCCAISASHPLARNPQELYAIVHECVAGVLRDHGIAAHLRGEARPERDSAFLCFARGDAHDLILSGHKILGSAQRRRKGAVLQHGSLILRRSEYAPQFPGLLDLVSCSVPVEQFRESLSSQFYEVLTSHNS